MKLGYLIAFSLMYGLSGGAYADKGKEQNKQQAEEELPNLLIVEFDENDPDKRMELIPMRVEQLSLDSLGNLDADKIAAEIEQKLQDSERIAFDPAQYDETQVPDDVKDIFVQSVAQKITPETAFATTVVPINWRVWSPWGSIGSSGYYGYGYYPYYGHRSYYRHYNPRWGYYHNRRHYPYRYGWHNRYRDGRHRSYYYRGH